VPKGSPSSIIINTCNEVIFAGTAEENYPTTPGAFIETSNADAALFITMFEQDHVCNNINIELEDYFLSAPNVTSEFTFITDTTIPANGKVQIAIPDEFTADNIVDMLGNINTFTNNGSPLTATSASLNDKVITVVTPSEIIAGNEIILEFDNTAIDQNPSSVGSYDFEIKTYNDINALLDSLTASVNIIYGSISNLSASLEAYTPSISKL